MANYSNYLSLTLPGAGEYRDVWWEPLNRNLRAIDSWAMTIGQEIVDARFSMSTLAEFLAVGHDTTGALKATTEAVAARNSPLYGINEATQELSTLKPRLDSSDWEIWKARTGQASLADALAFRMQGGKSFILSGSKDSQTADGYPDWLTVVGTTVTVNAAATNLWLSIDGKYRRVRTNIAIEFTAYDATGSGSAVDLTDSDGTKYLYAKIDNELGEIVVDGDATVAPPDTPHGAVSTNDSGDYVFFNDLSPAGKDFNALGVKSGDILNVLDSDNAGLYIIKQVTVGVENQIEIYGTFPVALGQSGINYTIHDPLSVKVGVDTVEVLETGKLYIAEIVVSSGSVTDYNPRHYGDTFISKWVALDSTVAPGIAEKVFYHGLNSDVLDISVQACATLGGEVQELGTTTITANYDVEVTSTLAAVKSGSIVYLQPTHAPDSLTVGDQTFTQGTFNPGSVSENISVALSGDVTAALTGAAAADNSVRLKWAKNQLWVKNAVAYSFFQSYSGVSITSGYLRVIVRKRG